MKQRPSKIVTAQYYAFRTQLEDLILELSKRVKKEGIEGEDISELIYTARNYVNRRNKLIKEKGMIQ